MALGETLKNARIQKGLSPSDVAEATHMMVQIVEDLEREDFRRIAAPIYGRGFVKLYAELLSLDPVPLIKNFMDLYSGAKAPSVRTRHLEAAEPPAERPVRSSAASEVPTTAAPQRQTVHPRPLVRPLSASQTPAPSEEKAFPAAPVPVRVEEEQEPVRTETPAGVPETERKDAGKPEAAAEKPPVQLVVEPEAPYSESDEPDLFHPLPRRRPEVSADEPAAEGEPPRAPARKPKLPIFKIGGRLEEPRPPEPRDEAAHARRRERVQKFIDGFKSLKHGVESKLPVAPLPRKQMLIVGGSALVLVVCMAVGIRALFKLTGSNVRETPSVLFETVAPPPSLYVD